MVDEAPARIISLVRRARNCARVPSSYARCAARPHGSRHGASLVFFAGRISKTIQTSKTGGKASAPVSHGRPCTEARLVLIPSVYCPSKASFEPLLSKLGDREQRTDVIETDQCHNDQPSSRLNIPLVRDVFGGSFDTAVQSDETPTIWGFPFHRSCWSILTKAFGHDLPDLRGILDVLLSVSTMGNGRLMFGHDYGGLLKPYPGSHEALPGVEHFSSWRPRSLPEYLLDPPHSVELRLILRESIEGGAYGPVPPPGVSMRPPVNAVDVFRKLPPEIIQMILLLLPSTDVASLRRASPTLAYLPLSEAFWISRFKSDAEFGFAFEAREDAVARNGHCGSLYNLLHRRLEVPSIRNRKRVWELATVLAATATRATELACQGQPHRTFLDADAPIDGIRWITASRNLRKPEAMFNDGCRALHQRSVDMPEGIVSIFASHANFFGTFYICGLRLAFSGDEQRVLGYIDQSTGSLAYKGEANAIMGFRVAQDTRGIRGLSVLSQLDPPTPWAGEYDELPKRRLIFSSSNDHRRITMLKGGFDVSPRQTHA